MCVLGKRLMKDINIENCTKQVGGPLYELFCPNKTKCDPYFMTHNLSIVRGIKVTKIKNKIKYLNSKDRIHLRVKPFELSSQSLQFRSLSGSGQRRVLRQFGRFVPRTGAVHLVWQKSARHRANGQADLQSSDRRPNDHLHHPHRNIFPVGHR